MSGKGLWGPIWGYIAIESDGSTVYGADFSHQGETPGLGAEIATPRFGGQFKASTLFKDNTFTSIAVVKPGQTINDQINVDGIFGWHHYHKGVNAMLLESVGQ